MPIGEGYMSNTRIKLLIVLFILFSTQFFRYADWNFAYAGWCSYFIYAFIVAYVYIYKDKKQAIRTPFGKEVWMLFFLFLLGIMGRLINPNFSLYEERNYIFAISTFLFYYIYYITNCKEQDIINIFLFISLCIFCIQVFQIAFPEKAVFGIYDEELRSSRKAIAEIRNGIYRFRVPGIFFTLFCIYYYWNKLLLRIKPKEILLFSILLASMYLHLTRQIMFATFFTLTCSFLFIKSSSFKEKLIAVIIACGIIGLYFASDLFGEFYKKTLQEANTGNIRWIATKFYWEKICSSPLTFLFGNGHPQSLQKWMELGLHPSDIGFIGVMFHYGVFWVLFYFYTVYLIIVKYSKMLPLYIKLFVFGTFIDSIMVFPYRFTEEYFVWASMLYIASLYIVKYQTDLLKKQLK